MSNQSAIAVLVDGGSPGVLPGRAIEVDAGVALPVAFGGLRKILRACEDAAPEAVRPLAQQRPAEWNRLFPGSIQGAPDLTDLALTPSERRLHRESEQIFWVLNLAARAIVETLRVSGRPLVIHGAGECDLVSLRAVMRAAEWGRLEQLEGRILLTGWNVRRPHYGALFEGRRRDFLLSLCERMRTASPGGGVGPVSGRALEPAVDLEGRYLGALVDEEAPLEHRIAAAVLAIRSCFFTTNYEGAMLAAERGLALLDAAGSGLSPARVAEGWDALDTGFSTPAIEIDKSSLGDAEELRVLFERGIGVVHVFTGQHDEALEAFGRALECRAPPERLAHMRMFRALTRTKRLAQLPDARAEVEAGIALMEGLDTPLRKLHEGLAAQRVRAHVLPGEEAASGAGAGEAGHALRGRPARRERHAPEDQPHLQRQLPAGDGEELPGVHRHLAALREDQRELGRQLRQAPPLPAGRRCRWPTGSARRPWPATPRPSSARGSWETRCTSR